MNLENFRSQGATEIRIDFGPDAYITYRFRYDGEPDEGWRVVDNRRRYPREVATDLTLEDAIHHVGSFTSIRKAEVNANVHSVTQHAETSPRCRLCKAPLVCANWEGGMCPPPPGVPTL